MPFAHFLLLSIAIPHTDKHFMLTTIVYAVAMDMRSDKGDHAGHGINITFWSAEM